MSGQAICPNGHSVRLARGLTCMVAAGWYWCPKCDSGYINMNNRPAKGMYYGPSAVVEAEDHLAERLEGGEDGS